MESSRGRFVGVGVRHYRDARLCELPHAIEDVDAVWRFLRDTFEGQPLRDAGKAGIESHLMGQVRDSLRDGGPLVLIWSGHGFPVGRGAGVRLMTADSDADDVSGFAIGEVLGPCIRSGADQVLVIVDSCFSGATVPSAVELASILLDARPPDSDHVWFGVLTSCSASDTAVDGRFGQVLRRLLTDGPTIPDLRRRWSQHNAQLRGDDLCDAIVKEWEGDDRRPSFRGDGSAWWMLPNPIYRPEAPRQVVEHLLRAARGGEPDDERSWFTGRTEEVNTLVRWVTDARPGVFVVTGSAGTGKSAVLGRVVSLADPSEREILLRAGRGWRHADPEPGAVTAHVHARGLTADRLAELLDEQLCDAGYLRPLEARRNAHELLGAARKAVAAGHRGLVLVVDGLDEARGEAFAIARDVLSTLGAWATVVVSTRPVPDADGETLVEALRPAAVIDLDSAGLRHATHAAIRDYVTVRLADTDAPGMDSRLVAGHVASTGAQDRPFLLARMITDQLRAHPVDTSRAGWESQIAASIEMAFDIDLARVEQPAPTHRQLPGGVSAAGFARTLLASLTWAFGAGFPEDEWHIVAAALSGLDVEREAISWVLEQLGRYVVQDGEAGVAVYRLAHQSLADHLRPPFLSRHDMIFDVAARPVSAVLLDYYRDLLQRGHDARAPGYLWRYAWRHAAQIGLDGLQPLRELAAVDSELRNDVALAAGEVSEHLRFWGQRGQALAPTEEAVMIRRGLVADNPGYLPNLAGALNNLGIRYSELGRRAEALAPTEEAVTTDRGLVAETPATCPTSPAR